VVLRDGDATEALSTQRYQQMLGAQQGTHQPATPVLPVSNTMTLPPLPSRAPASPTSAPGAAAPAASAAPSTSAPTASSAPAR
jgi:hypothetical protein